MNAKRILLTILVCAIAYGLASTDGAVLAGQEPNATDPQAPKREVQDDAALIERRPVKRLPPSAPGLAARYPGDVGIESHKSVVFRETFEQGGLADLKKRWTHISNKDGRVLALAKDSPPHAAGSRCIQMTATKGHDTGGYLWKLFKPGYDRLHARFYVKFAPDHPYVHHFVSMRAVHNSPNWPVGHAGHRPTGRDRFGSNIDLRSRGANPPGSWFLYSYWCEMRSYETPSGRGTKCYGNPFAPAKHAQAPRDKWQCVEFMIKANSTPDAHDGEQAFWIDGQLVAHFAPGKPKGTWLRDKFNTSGRYNTKPQPFEGFRWRTTDKLKINTFSLQTYLAAVFRDDKRPKDQSIPYNSKTARVWFDNIVIATEYIGPIAAKTTKVTPLFSEHFDDAKLKSRNWYDMTRTRIAGDAVAGKGCIEYEWIDKASKGQGSSGMRRLFEPTDEVYIRFYLKLSKGWGWTGRNYHPHLVHFLTTENPRYHGPAASHLTLYVEPVNGKLRLAAQDIQNKNMPHGLTQGRLKGGYNGKLYDSREVLFKDDRWHCVEAYFKLNTLDLANDKPNKDGIVRGWFDGKLVVEHTDVVLRSTDFPTMKFNQFLMAPYFGPGLLPHGQKLWIDELAVGTKRIGPLPQREASAGKKRLRE